MEHTVEILLQGWLGPEDPGWLYFVPLWPLGVFLLWALWNIARDSWDEKRMERGMEWPEVQGHVTASKMVWGHVEIRYEYWLFAKRYEGVHKISLKPVVMGGMGWESLRSAAALGNEGKGYMADFPMNAKVIVRYNKEKPEESVLFCAGEVGPPRANEPKVEAHFVTLD